MHFLMFYELADDYLERRASLRDAHLALAWQAQERGELVLAGAMTEPADCAVLLFDGQTPEVAERFAKADPYVQQGLVKRWYVRRWNTVVGDDAHTPVRPAG